MDAAESDPEKPPDPETAPEFDPEALVLDPDPELEPELLVLDPELDPESEFALSPVARPAEDEQAPRAKATADQTVT